jgi:AraC-like DNA-binding protein
MMARRATPVLEKRDEAVAPRGILYPERRTELDRHVRLLPSADLSYFVAHFWIVGWDFRGQPPRTQETLPHPTVHIALERHRADIYGIVKGRFTRVIGDRGLVFGIKFRPGGFYPFLRSPVSRLANKTVAVTDIFGPSSGTLQDTVFAQSSEEDMIEVAEQFLREQQPTRDSVAESMGEIVDRIAEDRTLTTVDAVAERFGYTTRSLQRLFARYVGISPKWVINRYRLLEVVERVAGGEAVDWTRLALDLGYFDQAHFIKDFKAIVGRTPGEYERITRTDHPA